MKALVYRHSSRKGLVRQKPSIIFLKKKKKKEQLQQIEQQTKASMSLNSHSKSITWASVNNPVFIVKKK